MARSGQGELKTNKKSAIVPQPSSLSLFNEASKPNTHHELVIEVFGHRDLVTQSFPPACLQHKIAGKGLSRCRLEGSKRYRTIRGITYKKETAVTSAQSITRKEIGPEREKRRLTGNDGPMVEYLLTECLTLRCRSQIRLEPVGINNGNEGFDGVERRSGFRYVLCDVTTSSGKHSVDGRYTVSWRLNFDEVDRLHQARSGLQRLWVRNSTESLKLADPILSR